METREKRLFRALDTEGSNLLTPQNLLSVLEDAGFDRGDPRLSELYGRLDELHASDERIDLSGFVDLLGTAGLLVTRAITENWQSQIFGLQTGCCRLTKSVRIVKTRPTTSLPCPSQ